MNKVLEIFSSLMHGMLPMAVLFSGGAAFSQDLEYRITDDRRYQYLSNRQEAGMIFDESLGTYYKDVTVRTFYLETLRKGFVPGYISYDTFIKMTLAQQRAILRQPFSEVDCSSNNISSQCLDFLEKEATVQKAENAQVVDLSPKCVDSKSPDSRMSLTTKLLLNPNDASIENIDCGGQPAPPPADKSAPQQTKTARIILGKE